MLLVISPAGMDCVTRDFSYRLLISYSQAAQFDQENTLATMIDTYKSQNVIILIPLYKGRSVVW